MKKEFKIDGKKVTLRPLRQSDVTQVYVDWLNDEDVNRYMESRHTQWDLESVREYVRVHEGLDQAYLLAILYNDIHVGNIKILYDDFRNGVMSVSFFIGEKQYWGKGLANEAISILSNFAFENLNAQKIMGWTYQENYGSAKALMTAGFQLEGILREHVFLNDNCKTNVMQFGFTKTDWAKK
jgi:RimJ/RimL family protein N-acetyltransferase